MYHGNFEDQADMLSRFEVDSETLKGATVLFAAYDCDYDGEALVVYRQKRKLYEVNASHCSCYGLEGQWDPEETSVEALRHRIDKGTLGFMLGGYTADFVAMLDSLTRKKKVEQSV